MHGRCVPRRPLAWMPYYTLHKYKGSNFYVRVDVLSESLYF